MSGSSSNVKPVRAGRVLGDRYTLVNRIAKGGMGEVWRARDKRSGMQVAAKVLRPELTGEEISLSRLRLEAKNTMRARHPNIAMVLDSGEDEGQGWIVMELVSGRPMTDFVGDGKRLTAEELIPILIQTAYALDGSAQAGIVHRDIKPANILVREDGMVKLTDFGISYSHGQANLTAVGMVMGTAQYLAPEQAMGGQATASGDLYSLGVIAYESLAGRRPFTGKSAIDIAMAHVKEDPPDLPDDVPEPLADIVFGLLAKDAADRPPSGTALVRALTRAAQEIGIPTLPRPLEGAKTPTRTRKKPETPVPLPSAKDHPLPTRREVHTAPTESQIAEPAIPIDPDAAPAKQARRPDGGSRPTPSPANRLVNPEPAAQEPVPSGVPDLPDGMRWKPVKLNSIKAPSAIDSGTSVPLPSRRGGTIPRRRPPGADGSAAAPTASAGERSNTGMWIIAGLVLLTVILIIIAMLRNGGDAAALANSALTADANAAALSNTEVDPWLSPVHGF